ncbi:MAG: hypothetical protein ABFC62_01120 [Clostridiaceae bacterium]
MKIQPIIYCIPRLFSKPWETASQGLPVRRRSGALAIFRIFMRFSAKFFRGEPPQRDFAMRGSAAHSNAAELFTLCATKITLHLAKVVLVLFAALRPCIKKRFALCLAIFLYNFILEK